MSKSRHQKAALMTMQNISVPRGAAGIKGMNRGDDESDYIQSRT